ncbi:MAG: Ig-like domain-containing protein [Bacteroidales bacterium]|nr:Ig-like domain-containing protein [Bacteroidales bacterium]
MGPSLLRLKANYVALGWDFDNNWDILETECFPYKKYQAAPPVIESTLVSHDTEISGSSLYGGTVYLYYKYREPVSTICNGHSWSFTTEALQSGATVQLYADVEDMTPSYLTSATVGYPGSGTEADPYRIYTADDLQGASNKGHYKLMNDIDLAAWINENSPTEGWVSIGRNSGEATYINGDGHKITGLWINTTQDYTGLFSNFSAGIIKNLTVEVASGKKVKGGDYTGVLIGRNANGQLINCTVKGDVEGTAHVGGITGYSGNNTINAVTYEGTVTSSTSNAYVGGFAGLSENDNITAVHTYVTISSTGSDSYVGGIIGRANSSSLTKSHAENAITATGANDFVGGAIGYSNANVTLCYTTGEITVSGDNSYTAGLVGYANNPIANSYSTAKVTGTYFTAGICAYTFSTIDKCYSKGNIYGVNYGAGVVGELDGTSASLTNSIAVNNILSLSAQSSWACRVIGGFKNGCPEPNDSNYALSTMQVSLNGVAQIKSDDLLEGIAKTESVLQTAQTYINLGWDYSSVWGIEEGEAYPYLLWEIDVNPVTEITLDNTSLIIAQGNTSTITASVMPLGATNKRLAWTTSNNAIATVDDGVVTAVGVGTATITATSTDGSNVSATCEVTVVANHDAAIAELQALVDNAQSLYDNSSEGENIGQYEPGARAALLAVIRSVRAQISSTMDDETIASCTNDINNAVAAFKAKQVTAGEDTDILAYDNIIFIEGTEAAAGQQVTLSLKMNNTINVTGFQFEIFLPEGITFASIEINKDRATSDPSGPHNISAVAKPDGSVQVLCYSMKNNPFEGNEGVVAYLKVDIDPTLEEGTYPLILRNIEISDANLSTTLVDYVKTTLTISSYTLGDANNDGRVSVTDIIAIANYILETPPASFVKKAADVNNDGRISVTDLIGVANIILYGSVSPNASNAKSRDEFAVQYSKIYANDVTTKNKDFAVAVYINGNTSYSGYQFDITLPDGLTVKNIYEQTNAFDLFMSRMINDNTLRVLGASTTVGTTESTIIYLTLEAEDESIYNVEIDNAIIASNTSAYALNNSTFLVSVGSDATGISNIGDEVDNNDVVYDLTGNKKIYNGDNSTLQKGIYIINGNKVLIK